MAKNVTAVTAAAKKDFIYQAVLVATDAAREVRDNARREALENNDPASFQTWVDACQSVITGEAVIAEADEKMLAHEAKIAANRAAREAAAANGTEVPAELSDEDEDESADAANA